MNLKEAEDIKIKWQDIKESWQEYTELYFKEILMTQITMMM